MATDTEDANDGDGYAVALRVRDRVCVVVGGGPVGERKAKELYRAGAKVTVIAPQITDSLQADAEQRLLRHRSGAYQADDLIGAFLAIAATDNAVVNAQVLADARARSVLANRAGETTGEAGSDFDTMATVRRGPLLIGVTAGGASPSVAAQVKARIAQVFGPEWGPWVTFLGHIRRRAKAEVGADVVRADFLRRLAARDDLRERLAGRDAVDAARVREEVEQMLSEAVQASSGQLDVGDVCPAR